MSDPDRAIPWGEVLSDAVGLGGFAFLCTGVYLLWGVGWTLIALGGPLFAGWAWREARTAMRSRRK